MITRVLHVVASLDQRYGGPLRVVLDLSAESEQFGVHSEVLGFGSMHIPDNPFPVERIHQLPLAFPESYGYSPALRPWLRDNLHRFDGVVMHGMWMYLNWAAGIECRAANKPYACFPHGMLEPWAVYGQGKLKAAKKLAYWTLRERRVCQNAAQLLFTTTREKELANGMFRLHPQASVVAPFGMRHEIPEPVPPVRQDLAQMTRGRVALFLGRIHPKKNVTFLVRAWAEAKMPHDWTLLIAGTGDDSYVREVADLVERLGLQEQVLMPGFVTGADKTYLLQRADWFLLPSSQENFWVAVLEAVEQGCAVAISDRVYLAEAFRGESEVIPVDLAKWTDFLRTRMRDRKWRELTVHSDRAHLLTRYESARVNRDWSATWTRLFGGATA